MSTRFDTKVEEARRLEEKLVSQGNHLDAQVIARLIHSAVSVRGTLKTIHRDNMELRHQLGLPSFLDDE